MDANLYQENAKKTANPNLTHRDALLNWCLGLAGEVGEFVELIKKSEFHGHELDPNKTFKELGDISYYLAMACDNLGFKFGDVLAANNAKLMKRYENGFSTEASLKRVDTKE